MIGTDLRERDLRPRGCPQPRFIVRSKKTAGHAFWAVEDQMLQIQVFIWFGPSGEAKSRAVADALNALEE